jgi:lysophospholipase L1-like esterase
MGMQAIRRRRTGRAPPGGKVRRVAAAALALAGLALAQAQVPAGRQAASPWADEVAAFQAADAREPPASGGIVFTGSSSIRLWPDLATDFPGMGVLNRGFGGSRIADATGYAQPLALRHRPRQVVLYAGDNDLAQGLAPEQVAADFAAFVRRLRAQQPGLPIAFVAIKPSPARIGLLAAQRRANALIQAIAAGDPDLDYIDVVTPMLDAAGRPRGDLFLIDGLHLNDAGYRLWRQRIAPWLRRPSGTPGAGQQEPGTRPGSGIAADNGRGDRI